MTDLTRYDDTSSALVRPDLLDPVTDSWVASIRDVVQLAGYICDTTFVPQGLRGSAPATAATILYGREIGVPPITALQTMHVINGRVGMAAELMRARVYAAGHELEVVESTTALCRMRGRRKGSETWTEVQWSKGDAQQAKLGGDAWAKYPRAMLVARCSAELCRLLFPDVTHGMAALEELDTPSSATTAAPASQAKLVGRRKTPPPQAQDPAPPGVVGTDSPQVGSTVLPTPPVDPPAVTPPTAPAAPPQQQPLLPGEDAPPEDDPREQGKLTGDGPATQPQVRHIMVLLRRLAMGAQRDERLAIAEAVCQRRIQSFSQLTVTDAGRLITVMLLALDSANPRDYMRWLVDEGQRLLSEQEARDLDAMAAADIEAGAPADD